MTTEEFEAKRKEMLAETKVACEYNLRTLTTQRAVLNGELLNLQWRQGLIDEREKDLRERLEVANRG